MFIRFFPTATAVPPFKLSLSSVNFWNSESLPRFLGPPNGNKAFSVMNVSSPY
jgi:hypothetical protein